MKIPIKMEDVFAIPFAYLFRMSTMANTSKATIQFLADPKFSDPLPPAIDTIPVGKSDKPIVSTTVPVTIFGKNLLSFFMKNPKVPPNNPPIRLAPNNPDMP